jgi:hypothetical protein
MSLQFSNKVIELSAYVQPKISEDKREDWVNYGEDNNYYQFLIERFLNSATNNAIINNICKLIYGEGLYAKDSFQKPEDWANVISIISQEELKKLIIDLYLLGQGSLQVHYNDKHDKVIEIFHIPQQLLRPAKCNEDGEIVTQYYSDNWQDVKKFKPKPFPVFGTSKEKIEILTIQPYSVGMKYFSYVDYQGALDYAVLEEKIAEYLINEVTNGFSPTTVLNFNNGQPADQEKDDITNRIMNQLTGSTGKKLVVSFNDNEATKTTIDSVPLNDAPEHYAYLSEECRTKIMVGHNVVSPLIFGIATTTGFSANADELQNSFTLYENMVIKPKQQLIIDSLKKIFRVNDINLDLAFKSLNPFKSSSSELQTLSKQDDTQTIHMNSDKSELELLLDEFGEDIDENYVLIDERDADYDNEEFLNEYLNDLENTTTKLSLIDKVFNFVSTGTARPTAVSSQDKQIKGIMFKVRYKYTGNPNPERAFCKAMMSANKVYRKEDIDRMSESIVNRGFGEFGADKYDIFRFHGGPRCHHKWSRLTYMLNDKDVFEKVGTRAAEIRGYKVTNPSEVSVYPNNLPLKGYSPRNKNLPSDVK